MHYLPLTDANRKEMLEACGATQVADFLKHIPENILYPELKLPNALSEQEIQKELKVIASQNQSTSQKLNFLGAGSYEHFIPSAVPAITSRSEFYTAYTPYQPEASQGTLQAIFEFQSLIVELTGMDVSNASHYDGATSLAEAALMAVRHTNRDKVIMLDSVHPHYKQVVNTYFEGTPHEAAELTVDSSSKEAIGQLASQLNEDIAAVVVQTPNFFGTIEDLEGWAEKIHDAGALLIVVFNPVSLGLLKTPGEWGADIAVGEGQSLGVPMQFGGPYLGLFAASKKLMRKIPGRLAGITEDSEGKRAYVLTLQAREQHIRRERAASNICTNQALCALTAAVYMTLMGKEGARQVASMNIERASYLRDGLSKVKGVKVGSEPIFNEFVVEVENLDVLMKHMDENGIHAGVRLEDFYPNMKNKLLVCVTETKSKEDLDRYLEAVASC